MKNIAVATLSLFLTLTAIVPAAQPVMAMRVELKATGRFSMPATLQPYERNVLKVVTEKCLETKADKLTKVEIVVDGHGHVLDLNLTNSGLNAEDSKKLVDDIRALNLGDAGPEVTPSTEIKLTFDLLELGGGPVNYQGTSLKVGSDGKNGASITGGGVIIGNPDQNPKKP